MAGSSIIALAGTVGVLALAPAMAIASGDSAGGAIAGSAIAGSATAGGSTAGGSTAGGATAGGATAGGAASGSAASGGDEILAPPPTFEAGGVTVDERLGSQVPLDAKFRTQDGALVTLGEVLRGGLPTILTFNYSDCPMLCNVQLNGLTAALPEVGERGPSPDHGGDAMFRVGAQLRVVTIDLEPNETLDKARAMRHRYLERLPEDQRTVAATGWTFLVAATPGDAAEIRRVADAVGFRYTYIRDRAEWAHPAALILLSAAGVVTRYVYGVEFAPAMLRESIYRAGLAEPSAAAGFLLRCYHYDPGARSHARDGVTALRVAAAGFVVLVFAGLGALHLRSSRRRPRAGRNGVT
jgi:protein SCO1